MKLPVLVTRSITVFPGTTVSLDIGREISVSAINIATINNRNNPELESLLLVVSQNDDRDEVKNTTEFYNVGTLTRIVNKRELTSQGAQNPEYTIELLGLNRITLDGCDFDQDLNSFVSDYKKISNTQVTNPSNPEYKERIFKTLDSLLTNDTQRIFNLTKNEINAWKAEKDLNTLIGLLAQHFNFTVDDAVFLLKENSLTVRLQKVDDLLTMLNNEVKKTASKSNKTSKDISKQVDMDLNNKINSDLSKQQREFYLREKLKAIRDELNEGDEEDSVDKIRDKVQSNPYPEHIKKRILSELHKYESSQQMQEASMVKAYIDWLVNLPWWQTTKDNSDLNNVEKVLNDNHYGLTKVKERILEYLAVQGRTKNATKAPIVCLVGPPGVGKTSLAFSIAQALGRQSVKVSLGGVRDEAEIRGHRRTYLGAMPGRIISGMKKAGVVNPVFILDEIDKMASDYRGDPASAMLEVLDPEQNKRFSDNYIEEEYDLSKVMFIATANYVEQIPEALFDRMEIIELTSYTENEKLAIAKSYLIPKTMRDYDLKNGELVFTDEAIKKIIRGYTREAGVRELERLIQRIARKFIVRMDKGEIKTQLVDEQAVVDYLKKELFDYTKKDKAAIPGVVNGMAYTTAGGDLLPIEVSYSQGKGDVTITGNLKETMNESAKVALGFVKAHAEKYHIDPEMFGKIDIHIHVPSGGIPKDGPSAGVTLTTALLSALKNCPVPTTISMTGEITLRGRVGIIGGVKEKTISAFRGGINEIFMPSEDEKFLDDVPEEIKSKIKFHFVDVYDDIYDSIFAQFDKEHPEVVTFKEAKKDAKENKQ